VLVHVSLAGICETDLQIIRGYMGFEGVLGHEFVGVAETGIYRGQRVVGEVNCGCRECEQCLAGLSGHCPHRTVLGILNRDGAFAEFLQLPEANLHRVPDEVSTRAAVFTEPLAAAFQLGEQVRLSPGLRTLVIGDGRLGNLCAQVLKLHGCHVLVIGKHERKLSVLEHLGIRTQLLTDTKLNRVADLVVDCTGSATGLPLALELVKPRGTIVLKTTVAAEHRLSMAPVVIDELRIIGSRCGPFSRALEALRNREVEVEALIEAVYPFDRALEALDRARNTPALKVLLAAHSEAE
jgi:threonine dehydrogenase-like Zn-dependent dehydrogenase